MDEVLDVFLQCLMGLQRDGQVAIVLLVAEVHLDAWGYERPESTNQNPHCLVGEETGLWLTLSSTPKLSKWLVWGELTRQLHNILLLKNLKCRTGGSLKTLDHPSVQRKLIFLSEGRAHLWPEMDTVKA